MRWLILMGEKRLLNIVFFSLWSVGYFCYISFERFLVISEWYWYFLSYLLVWLIFLLLKDGLFYFEGVGGGVDGLIKYE